MLTKERRDELVDIIRDVSYSEDWVDVKYALISLIRWIEVNVPVQD